MADHVPVTGIRHPMLHPFRPVSVSIGETTPKGDVNDERAHFHAAGAGPEPGARHMLHAGDTDNMLRARREGRVLRGRSADDEVWMPVSAPSAPAVGLWSDLHDRLRRFVGRRIADPDTADDVAQDVLLRLHRSLGDLRVDDRLDAFAYRIARNAIIDHYRAHATAKEFPAAPDELIVHLDADRDIGEDADGQARQELARCLEPLVGRLPEPYREALMLTDLGELSQVEAARLVGLSIPGMKARVQRARARLHELLTDCCEVALDGQRQIAAVRPSRPCACIPG